MRLSVSLESASERFVLVQVAAAVVGAEAGEDMEEGSVVEDEEVVEVAEAVAGAGVDAKETGFALTRGAFPIVCSSIFCWTRFLQLCYSGLSFEFWRVDSRRVQLFRDVFYVFG